MITDEAFNEAYKPLHIPSAYNNDDSWKDKIVFALAELGAGTVGDVTNRLMSFDTKLDAAETQSQTETILTDLFNKGLVKGTRLHHGMLYNLSKILTQNSGSTHPSQ